jgi:hypothetical protein
MLSNGHRLRRETTEEPGTRAQEVKRVTRPGTGPNADTEAEGTSPGGRP